LLYLILLLHDIGKGKGIQGHADTGVTLAAPVLERLQVDADTRATVNFIIKNHLVMARFWQKHDLDDPQTSAAFADLVVDPDRLRYLYVHTFCDARGTSTNLWNGYKDTLHQHLFETTLERLTLGDKVETRLRELKEMTRQTLIAQTIPGISPDEVTAHFNLLPERYFVQTDAGEITLHIQMVNRLLHSISAADSLARSARSSSGRTTSTAATPPCMSSPGIAPDSSTSFPAPSASPASAFSRRRSRRVPITSPSTPSMSWEPGRGVVQNQAAMETFARTVEEALVANRDLMPDITAQAQKLANARYTTQSSELPASFPPTIEVYNEISLKRIIVEVQAHDQIGLLYRLVKAISDHGFDTTLRPHQHRAQRRDRHVLHRAQQTRRDGRRRPAGGAPRRPRAIITPAPAAAVCDPRSGPGR